eukprot:c40413_g1_i1 orf=86-340(-)
MCQMQGSCGDSGKARKAAKVASSIANPQKQEENASRDASSWEEGPQSKKTNRPMIYAPLHPPMSSSQNPCAKMISLLVFLPLLS